MFLKNNKGVLSIPMWISLLLLPCFLAYFLKSEYNNEEKAIISKKREKAFENIFSLIDTVSADHATNPGRGTNVKWVRDSTGREVRFQLSYVWDSINMAFNHADTLPNFTHTNSVNLDKHDLAAKTEISITLENRELPDGIKEVDTSIYIKNIASTEEFVIGDWQNCNFDDSSHILEQNDPVTVLQILDQDNQPSFVVTNIEVPWTEIIKGITPQILFSFFLLFSVWSSFFLFVKSIKKERQLTELRNDFMSNMSHELKTPVSTISVALEALKNFNAANDESLRKEYIDISKSEVDRLGLLVDKALNISLYEQGKFVYEKQVISLDLEIRRILKTLKIQLENQNVSLNYETSGAHFFVNSDKTHITNVIHNLIENGIKYSKEPANISIKLIELPNDIRIEIIDQGIGIPLEYQTKIFDKFFRVPKGNTHNVKGHGLGLSYVKDVISSQGGNIEVKSEVNKGSTFIITLPKIEASE